MNLKPVLILLGLALATIFALVCVLLTRERSPRTCQHVPPEQEETEHGQSLVFADLTAEEMSQVVWYLQGHLGVPLVEASRAKPSENCIAWVDVQVPAKAEVLRFLDSGGARPPREALAVLYFGKQPEPNITELVVGPLPRPAYHRDVTVQKYGGKVPYHRRPTLAVEYKQIGGFLKSQVFPSAPAFMQQVMEYDGANLATVTAAPRGFQSGDRVTWFVLFQNVSGFFLHPVGLEVLVDHSSLDISEWAVSRVFYNGQYYRDMVQLESAYVQGQISVEKVRKAPWDGDFSSMKPRAPAAALFPLQFEPQGPRYSVSNNQVFFQGWSFAFGMSVSTGLRLFDIRHKGERVAYEISVQEAMSVYGSNCPGGMSTRYMDGSFGLGRYTSPLVPGVDCPYLATYVDTLSLSDSLRPQKRKASLCIFEQNLGSPLRRHYSNLQSLYYGGLVNSALVLRSITTVGNYDYVWDFIFYQNGALEGKVQATGYPSSSFFHGDGLRYGNRLWEHTLGTIHTHFVNYKVDLDVAAQELTVKCRDAQPQVVNSALVLRSITTVGNYDYGWDFIFYQYGALEGKVQATGYPSSSFLLGDGLRYGNRLWEHTLGTIHTHFVNYKVDLDVGGVKNSLMAHDMAFEMARAPWSPEQQIERPRLTKKVLDTEDQAAFLLHSKMPRYIYFAANSKNKWGHQRGYRIQITSSAGDHIPEASSMERAISWARYQLAVTQRKEEEPTSTSIYNQNDPWTPTVAFADFINNETITNQDLVAWITAGFLHIPHSEDIPNTVTVGNSVGFLLRPYNYYDLDPSIYSQDGVFFTREQDFTACEINPLACLPKTASCLPNFPPFTFDGFRNMSRL